MKKGSVKPVKVHRDRIELIDQRFLPLKEEWVTCADEKETALAIKDMVCRGAPLIGIVAAYGYYLGVNQCITNGTRLTQNRLDKIQKVLKSSRPTAVNLTHAMDIMHKVATENISLSKENPLQLLLTLFQRATDIHELDRLACEEMSNRAADHITKSTSKKTLSVLTHCNTGALACGGSGTALGFIRELANRQKLSHVYIDETRPYLQGARLTAYECLKDKLPATLIVDSMAAVLMQKKEIDLVVVGADRVAKDHGFANKVGTYMLSVLAKYHKIPFYVIAPESTFDSNLKFAKDIPIEQRPAAEVLEVQGVSVTKSVKVLNDSFDVTPAEHVTAIFSETRTINPMA